MEINIEKNTSSKYYDEVLSVMSNYKKLVKNPNQKIASIKRQATILTGISLIFLVIFAILYARDVTYSLYMYVVVIFAVALVLGIIYYLLINRRISSFKSVDSAKRLVVENEFVEMHVGSERTRLEMSEIQHILINNYSICFLPKNVNSKMIAVDVKYKDSILKAIDNKSLIIDNSSLY
jgi:hypothetical protein